MKPRLAVDWDDTCVPNRFPDQPREWLPGAVWALSTLSMFVEVVVFSCRVAPYEFGDEATLRSPAKVTEEINYIRSMLDSQGLNTITVWTKNYKPPAFAYVDDKGVHYNGRKGAWAALVPKLLIMAGLDPVYHDEEGGN